MANKSKRWGGPLTRPTQRQIDRALDVLARAEVFEIIDAKEEDRKSGGEPEGSILSWAVEAGPEASYGALCEGLRAYAIKADREAKS